MAQFYVKKMVNWKTHLMLCDQILREVDTTEKFFKEIIYPISYLH